MKKQILMPIFCLLCFAAGAQNIFLLRSVNSTGTPQLTWFTFMKGLKPDVVVYRAPMGGTDFQPVKIMSIFNERADTTLFYIIDTTLTKKGFYQYFIQVRDARDSAWRSDIGYGHNLGALPSPAVVWFNAIPDSTQKAIILEWKLSYSFTVKSITLFRSRNYEKGFEIVANLPGDATRWTDRVTVSNEPWYYFFQVRDFFGFQYPSPVFHGFATFAEKGIPPQDFTVSVKPGQVTLSWKALGGNLNSFRVYRQTQPEVGFIQAGPAVPATANELSFIDTALTMPGITSVRYYAVSVSDGFLESNPTDTLTVALPWNLVLSPPAEVDWVIDSINRVHLFWTQPMEGSGVTGFNIYRSYKGSEFRKLNENLISPETNEYTDMNPMGYGAYEYALESVGVDGIPSAVRSSAYANRPYPHYHIALGVEQTSQGVELKWPGVNLPGLTDLYIFRQEDGGTAKMLSMTKPGSGKFIDSQVSPGIGYIYTLIAEFSDGGRILVNDGVLVEVR